MLRNYVKDERLPIGQLYILRRGLCVKMWRFLGLQSKNRKEWFLFHLANFYAGATTVALMDAQSPDSTEYIVNQTELTTIALSGERAEAMIKLKESDKGTAKEKVVRNVS